MKYVKAYIKNLSRLLNFVFVSLSGSSKSGFCPHRCLPVFILSFYWYLNLCFVRKFSYSILEYSSLLSSGVSFLQVVVYVKSELTLVH